MGVLGSRASHNRGVLGRDNILGISSDLQSQKFFFGPFEPRYIDQKILSKVKTNVFKLPGLRGVGWYGWFGRKHFGCIESILTYLTTQILAYFGSRIFLLKNKTYPLSFLFSKNLTDSESSQLAHFRGVFG